jgi:hypothetical protein
VKAAAAQHENLAMDADSHRLDAIKLAAIQPIRDEILEGLWRTGRRRRQSHRDVELAPLKHARRCRKAERIGGNNTSGCDLRWGMRAPRKCNRDQQHYEQSRHGHPPISNVSRKFRASGSSPRARLIHRRDSGNLVLDRSGLLWYFASQQILSGTVNQMLLRLFLGTAH